MTKIGEARHNEKGEIGFSVLGDQTLEEVCVSDYRPEFTVVYRAKDPAKRSLLWSAMTQACRNDHIGYSQASEQRYTMYHEMLKTGNIDWIDNDCATDCSQLVANCCIIVGIPVSPYMYTGDAEERLMNTGMFDRITDFSENDLREGDILWRKGHMAIVLEENPHDEFPSKKPKYVAEATTLLNVRTGPGTTHKKYSAWPLLGEGNRVDVCDTDGNWAYIRIAGSLYAWASLKYLRKI